MIGPTINLNSGNYDWDMTMFVHSVELFLKIFHGLIISWLRDTLYFEFRFIPEHSYSGTFFSEKITKGGEEKEDEIHVLVISQFLQ